MAFTLWEERASLNPLRALNRTKRQRKGKYILFWSGYIHLLLLLDTGAPDSWAFRF
jgi:hypothetical protein